MWKLMILAGASALAFGGGMRLQTQLDAGREVKTIIRTITVVQKQGQVTAQVAQQVQAKVDHAQSNTQTIVKEIPVAVPSTPDSDPVLVSGWVRLHNDAALGLPPDGDAAGQPDGSPSGFVASEALRRVVENYGVCAQVRAVAQGWQDWYAQTAKAQ